MKRLGTVAVLISGLLMLSGCSGAASGAQPTSSASTIVQSSSPSASATVPASSTTSDIQVTKVAYQGNQLVIAKAAAMADSISLQADLKSMYPDQKWTTKVWQDDPTVLLDLVNSSGCVVRTFASGDEAFDDYAQKSQMMAAWLGTYRGVYVSVIAGASYTDPCIPQIAKIVTIRSADINPGIGGKVFEISRSAVSDCLAVRSACVLNSQAHLPDANAAGPTGTHLLADLVNAGLCTDSAQGTFDAGLNSCDYGDHLFLTETHSANMVLYMTATSPAVLGQSEFLIGDGWMVYTGDTDLKKLAAVQKVIGGQIFQRG